MQGMVMGMNHMTTGLGALLGSALYNAVALITAAAGNIYTSTCNTDHRSYCRLSVLNKFSSLTLLVWAAGSASGLQLRPAPTVYESSLSRTAWGHASQFIGFGGPLEIFGPVLTQLNHCLGNED